MMTRTILFTALLFTMHTAQAQLRMGFKTGLNFATMNGPSEADDAGTSLESTQNVTGFHIGATFSQEITDNFGIRAELLYSKKGMRYSFDGQAYRNFSYTGGSTRTTGTARYRLNVNNSWLDIPLVAYGRFGSFEISAGGYAAVLLSSVGDGSMQYNGKTIPLNNPTGELMFLLDYNYRKDAPGGGDSKETIQAKVDSKNIELPRYLGAYYDLPEDKGNLYNNFDYGLTGGVTYFLSRALYATVRLQYGLADLTNNNADLSKVRTNQGELIYLNDKDTNFTIQASVGFSF
ncbi:MAG: outer membrane beta-barrel protein [Lewinellaceae bacterium]|nr:outer membrane beta-barrel protein [Lewinellaceae bacterium]